jgi:hypothetical protein
LNIEKHLNPRSVRRYHNIPSPQGDFLVVMSRTLVGILTGPLTLNRLSLAPRTKSVQTVNHKRNQKLESHICNVFQTFKNAKKKKKKPNDNQIRKN